MSAEPITDLWLGWLQQTIDVKGVEIPHALRADRKGSLTAIALALPPDQAYPLMLAEAANGARELIFAFDRFARPGQGTELGDVMAGHHFADNRWRPFIVEYQHEPRIVKPICWTNLFWNATLNTELQGAARVLLRKASAAAQGGR